MTKTETPNAIKQRLRRERGMNLTQFAQRFGFKYRDVSDTVRGLRRGNYGVCREIRLALGLPVPD
ncbi:MAG: hypothetical protein FWC58_04200 [Desulfobulbus sp.]|nr:hypothetical protein [Desulfobulbus sp.]